MQRSHAILTEGKFPMPGTPLLLFQCLHSWIEFFQTLDILHSDNSHLQQFD